LTGVLVSGCPLAPCDSAANALGDGCTEYLGAVILTGVVLASSVALDGQLARDPRLRAEVDRRVPGPSSLLGNEDHVAVVEGRKRRPQRRPGMLLDVVELRPQLDLG